MNILFLIVFTFFINGLAAQVKIPDGSYIKPLKLPFSFSGSFGELRPSHFHSGLDFRTQGRTGIPVYAVKDGFISRISVSPTGYGKALYMTHPDGKTSVYGHLERFLPEIEKYVKEVQYYTENFKINVTLDKGIFEFKKGDIIAWSGNTGSSGGPHLHFEIRETKSERVLNPIFFIPGIKDNTAPNITSLYLYPLSESSHINKTSEKKRFLTTPYQNNYLIKNNAPILLSGKIGFGIQANDLFNGAGFACGIYSAEVLCDDKPVFAFKMNNFSFDQTGYANSNLDFEEQIVNGRKVYRLYRQPGNELDIFDNHGDGIINFEDGKSHKIEIIVSDAFNNKSSLKFKVMSYKYQLPVTEFPSATIFKYKEENRFENNQIIVKVPKGALYEDLKFFYGKGAKPKGCYSIVHEIHDRTVPIHKSMHISIKTENVPEDLGRKCLIIAYDEKTGKKTPIGGEYSNGWVSSPVSSFGNFTVAIDTIPPTISALSIKNKSTLVNNNKIEFKISDDLSGIRNFRCEIDDRWVLFEHDAKTQIISHIFDNSKIAFGNSHQLSLEVVDNRGNKSTYKAEFFK